MTKGRIRTLNDRYLFVVSSGMDGIQNAGDSRVIAVDRHEHYSSLLMSTRRTLCPYAPLSQGQFLNTDPNKHIE